jgi:hypothetical protein
MPNPLPEVGDLVRLNPWSSTVKYVRVESLDEARDDESLFRDFDDGTLAVVVGYRGDDNTPSGTATPVVMVDDWVGWIFNDEWSLVSRAT